jgi:regulator of RNase E activity RraB
LSVDYPDDAIGQALRDLAAEGNDMAAEMAIDFTVIVPIEKMASKFARTAESHGYRVGVWKRQGDEDWDVICSKRMLPTHENIATTQRELMELVMPFLGFYDGWATFGNKGDGVVDRG